MIPLSDYWTNLTQDSTKFLLSLTTVNLTNPTVSAVYFALLYSVVGYYYQEIRISSNEFDRCLLIEDFPLLTTKNRVFTDNYNLFLTNPYETFSSQFGIKLNFKILTNEVIFQRPFLTVSEITQLISWNASDILIYKYPDYYSDWSNITGTQLISYLLHIGLVFRNEQTFTIFYNTKSVNKFIDGQIIAYTEYSFFVTFKLDIPPEFLEITAQEVI